MGADDVKRVKVCAWIGPHGETCPELAPCEKHARPRNAPWSTDRDRGQQRAFRAAVLARDGQRCVRCQATTDLVAHHVLPGYNPSAGVTLCRACHRAVDANAR